MNIRSKWSSIREYLTPISHESNFRTTGEISPDEFVLAGDYLVLKFPTWAWGSGPKHLHKKFLPADKQFLVTRHVPSYKRYASFLPEANDATGFPGDNSMSEYGAETTETDAEWIPLFRSSTTGHAPEPEQAQDLDDWIEENAEDDFARDDAEEYTNIASGDANVRRYDLYIAYSTSYRVPKVYLVGFDGNGIPLLPPQMYEDISGDHKDKTATIEPLPMAHNTTSVSIHPCKHLSVMKVFMEHARTKRANLDNVQDHVTSPDLLASGGAAAVRTDEGIRVDQYLVIFLKFIASVTPGIEYDFTMDAL